MTAFFTSPIDWTKDLLGKLLQGLDKNTFAKAGISSVLLPRLEKHLSRESKVCLIGGRCRNGSGELSGNPAAYPDRWVQGLRKVLGQCQSLTYLLIEPDETAWANLNEMAQEFEGRLRLLRIPSADTIGDADLKKLVEECRTAHFLLASEPRQIWIEGDHPPDSQEAFNCEYVPPSAAAGDVRFDRLNVIFKKLESIAQSA